MNIRVSNDDGVDAIGLKTLVEHLKKIAQVTVVAPDRNRSGSSSSLTLDKPLMVNEVEKNTHAITDDEKKICIAQGERIARIVSKLNHV